jgi:hypothetical protein
MPRSVYHQSPGNPLQHSRLPAEPLELEFAYHRGVDNDDHDFTVRVLQELVFAGFAGLVCCLLQTLFFSSSVLPLIVFAVLLLCGWQFVAARFVALRDVLLMTLTATWIYDLLPLPMTLEIYIALTVTALLAREVVRHFTFVATVAPTPLERAWDIRDAVNWQTFASSLLLLPLAFSVFFPARFAVLLLIWLSGLAILAGRYVNQPEEFASNFWDCIRSWFSYNRDDQVIPGVLVSPAGPCRKRLWLTVVAVLLNSLAIFRFVILPFMSQTAVEAGNLAASSGIVELVFQIVFAVILMGLAPTAALAIFLISVCIVGTPVFGRLAIPRPGFVPADEWKQITDRIRRSHNDTERASLYLGRVSFDQSPLLVPKEVFHEHAHFLGDSGSGKTARGLAPLIEQLLGTGNASVMVLDLKGDSQELLQTIRCGAATATELSGTHVPIRYFTLRDDQATHGFNPFSLPCWNRLNDLQKTDVLCGALGLNYGSDYGEGYFTSANAAVLYATVGHFPDISSFEQLAEKIGYVIARPKAHGIDEKSRDAGNHVRMTVTRLASVAALNISQKFTPSESVLEHCIDPSRLFEHPEAHYYSLSATLGPGSSPEVARLATFMLMMASTMSKRKVPVYLVIDEFQRMASRNLDYLLQLARSMGVAVILANQSMQDLKRYDLVPTLETNCRYRQWFAVSGWEDQDRLSQASGETIDLLNGRSESQSSNSRGIGTSTSTSCSSNQFIGPRLTKNDIKLVSDEDRKSIVLINRGAGYAQYGGMPVIVESDFHISAEEYDLRKSTPWPSDEIGTFVPENWQRPHSTSSRPGRAQAAPSITKEAITVVGTTSAVADGGDDDRSKTTTRARPKKRRRRKVKRGRQPQAAAVAETSATGDLFERYLRENPIESDGEPSMKAEGE